jgi:hypothetical protein
VIETEEKREPIMSTNSRTLKQAADQKLIAGIGKHASTVPAFVVGNTSYKPADLVAIIQTRVTAADTTVSTRATWQNAVQAERDARTRTQAVVFGLKQTLQAMFAGSLDALADFGLTPRKPRVVTPEKKALAAARAKATREARHTMGKNQKKDIKGTVPAPASASPGSAPTPAPAPAAAQAPTSK